jgi:YbgC/YbaW family acyl-CoA thioester hydrolase
MKQNTIERRIGWGDLDPLGIVFYPRFYEWMDAAGHAFFAYLGLPLDVLWKERGLQFGLLETGCRYRRPGRYHEIVRIRTGLEAVDDKRVQLAHRIACAEGDVLMAEGFEKRICMDVSDPLHIRAAAIPRDVGRVLETACG